jgi:CBS domain-containing protein
MATVAELQKLTDSRFNVLTISPDATVLLAAQKLRNHRVGCLVVVDEDNHLLGVLSERDIVQRAVAERLDPSATSVGEIMTDRVIACSPGASLEDAHKLMSENNIRHLPILKGSVPLALISSRDLLIHRLQEMQNLAGRQRSMLDGLESQHPGITNIRTDDHGRIVI